MQNPVETKSVSVWIIGYGNPQRGDDGVGSRVVAEVDRFLGGRPGIRTLVAHQPGPELVEDLQDADVILFVDAAAKPIADGWDCSRVKPQSSHHHHLTHHFSPGFLLGLLDSLYDRKPTAWMISIQGDDFEIGEGLTHGAESRARQAVARIERFLDENYLFTAGVCSNAEKQPSTDRG